MITEDAYWKGPDEVRRDEVYAEQVTLEIRENAEITIAKANELLERAGLQHIKAVNSGWRPLSVNERTKNAAIHSSHMTGEAIDIDDDIEVVDRWCLENKHVLKELGLWLEHPGWTKGWCHVQTRPPGWPPNPNGPRIYIPSNNPATITAYGLTPIRDA